MIEALARADEAVRDCLDAWVWALPEADLVNALDAVHTMEQRLAAVKLALVREIDRRGVATAAGASSTAVWLRERLQLSISGGRRLVADAAALDEGPGLRRAVAAGQVTVEQARIIGDAVATVRTEAGVEAADKAVHVLIDWAGRSEPGVLRGLAERILAHVAPDLAEEADRRALDQADKRAERDRHLTVSTDPSGQARVSGQLDAETATAAHRARSVVPAGRPDGRPHAGPAPATMRWPRSAGWCCERTSYPSTVATRCRSSSPLTTTRSPVGLPRARRTAEFDSPRRQFGGWRATRQSCRRCSAAPGRCSMLAANAA